MNKIQESTYIDYIVQNVVHKHRIGYVENADDFKLEFGLQKSTFSKYWKIAKPKIESLQNELRMVRESVEIEGQKLRAEIQIVEKHERMQIASRIARGEPMVIKGIDGTVKDTICPSTKDILRALEYLSKVEGDYRDGPTINNNTLVNTIECFDIGGRIIYF